MWFILRVNSQKWNGCNIIIKCIVVYKILQYIAFEV